MQKILALIHNQFEDLELLYPIFRLREAGHQVVLAGEEAEKTYQGVHGYPYKSDISFNQAKSSDYAALLIPGGFAPDKFRRFPEILTLVQEMHQAKKIIGFICHGGWVPISAKILDGKKVTGTVAIKDDFENAGAIWVDEAVVIDGNLISSRTPPDLPQFGKALVEALS